MGAQKKFALTNTTHVPLMNVTPTLIGQRKTAAPLAIAAQPINLQPLQLTTLQLTTPDVVIMCGTVKHGVSKVTATATHTRWT